MYRRRGSINLAATARVTRRQKVASLPYSLFITVGVDKGVGVFLSKVFSKDPNGR